MLRTLFSRINQLDDNDQIRISKVNSYKTKTSAQIAAAAAGSLSTDLSDDYMINYWCLGLRLCIPSGEKVIITTNHTLEMLLWR